jgi:hypothetical protein
LSQSCCGVGPPAFDTIAGGFLVHLDRFSGQIYSIHTEF